MSASDEKKVSEDLPDNIIGYSGDPAQIDPFKGKKVKVTVDGHEIGLVTAADLQSKVPVETKDQKFIRLFKGAFYGPNAMRKHAGRKAKKRK